MSFPSALSRLQQHGDTPEAALLHAMEHDTPLGFRALVAVAEAYYTKDDPLAFICARVPEVASDVLRLEHINEGRGLKIDFNPLAPVGMQISRILGTDIARPLMECYTKMSFGFANCCGPIVGPEKEDTAFSARDQIRWQHAIDC